MAINKVPDWMEDLDYEDITFIKRFILASGSLKDVANQYEVTYPTIRLKLDRLIQKIEINDKTQKEPYISIIKRLAVDEKIDFETAKILVEEYRRIKGGV